MTRIIVNKGRSMGLTMLAALMSMGATVAGAGPALRKRSPLPLPRSMFGNDDPSRELRAMCRKADKAHKRKVRQTNKACHYSKPRRAQ